MNKKKKAIVFVYIAGPYCSPQRETDIATAIETAHQLYFLKTETQFLPFVPNTFPFWDLCHLAPFEQWTPYNLAWVSRCNAFLRLPGDPSRLEKEVEVARICGIPIFDSIDDLTRAFC